MIFYLKYTHTLSQNSRHDSESQYHHSSISHRWILRCPVWESQCLVIKRISDHEQLKTHRCLGSLHKCRTVSWVLKYGGMGVVEHNKGCITAISGNHSEKLEITGRIKLDQCFSAPQMGSTKKQPQNSPDPLTRGSTQPGKFISSHHKRVWWRDYGYYAHSLIILVSI